MGRRFARLALVAGASTLVVGLVGCGLTDVGGLGGSAPLGDADLDTGFDAAQLDTGGPHDATAEDGGALFDVEPDAPADAPAEGDAGCPPIGETNPCKAIPMLLETQTIDGDAIDFVCMPTTSFTLDTAAATVPDPYPTTLAEQVRMRYAWTPFGLAVHVHVVDPSVVVVAGGDPDLWNGDAIELFVSGTSALTGAFDGTNDPQAMQIIVTPGVVGTPARAHRYQAGDKGPIPDGTFATKLTSDGYSIELGLPWSFLGGAGKKGAVIGLDLAVDVDDDAGHAATREVWASWVQQSVPPGIAACPGAYAWCDDRAWCTPMLE